MRSLGARSVFPHAVVGLHYVTQRFEIDETDLPFKSESSVAALRRYIDGQYSASALDIEVSGVNHEGDCREPRGIIKVAVKVRQRKRQAETPSNEATGEDLERLFAGFQSNVSSARDALAVHVTKAYSPTVVDGHFGETALQAAFDSLRITFVGPKGERGRLEQAALRIPDLRLRPEVIYNFLALRAALHADEPPPPIQEVHTRLQKYYTNEQYNKELQSRTDHVDSDELEQMVAPSDVAGVRACAQPEAHMEEADGVDENADRPAVGSREPAPQMEHVGVVEYSEQGMEAVIAGFDAAIARNEAWRLRLAPCSDVQRAQLRTLCRDEEHVSFHATRFDASAGRVEAHVVLRRARRAAWLVRQVAGSLVGDWTPVVLSAEDRSKLLAECCEGAEHEGARSDVDDLSDSICGIDGAYSESDGDAHGEVMMRGAGAESDGSVRVSHSSSRARTGHDAQPSPLEIGREATPLDDYTGGAQTLYDAWWPHFLLKRGLRPGVTMSDDKIRHLFLYFDNRFAHDMQLLFHLANVKMRHAVNSAVGVRVKTNQKAFKDYQDIVNDDGFLEKLREAKQSPKGRAAREITSKLINLVNLTGKAIPWGSHERAAEVRPHSLMVEALPHAVHSHSSCDGRLSWAHFMHKRR